MFRGYTPAVLLLFLNSPRNTSLQNFLMPKMNTATHTPQRKISKFVRCSITFVFSGLLPAL